MSRQSPQIAEHAEERHEELFLARYAALLRGAHGLTGGDAARAEDLVQDAFVHFTVARPPLERIGNLDGYLYVMLRNLHLSQSRRAARLSERMLSAVEYDSAEMLLRATDPRDLIRTQDELRQVCRYACARKETSKAGSVLILRFFHGYYPSEIALLAGGTRESVEERLRVARNEARQFLKDPASLRFVRGLTPHEAPPTPLTGYAQMTDELLAALRRAIFETRKGDCPAVEEMEETYLGPAPVALETKALSHLVGCPRCMDEANRLLGLAPLSERYPTDTSGAETRPKEGDGNGDGRGGDGGPPSGGASGEQVKRCRLRVRNLVEHCPEELCVAVNGRVLAAQKTGTPHCEQKLVVTLEEKIEFVEVFSEQEVRLLFLNVNEHFNASDALSACVILNDERRLEATLDLGGRWPTVRVVYEDPAAPVAEPARQFALSPARVLREVAPLAGQSVDRAAEEEKEETPLPGKPAGRAGRVAALAGFLKNAAGRLGVAPFRPNPATVTAALALLVVAALLFTRMGAPAVTAAELLQRAGRAEDRLAGDPSHVLHRTFQLEETGGAKAARTRRRVEVWQSAARGTKLRRVFDAENRLVAAELQGPDGSRTTYERGTAPRTSHASPDALALAASGEAWRLDLSAKTFLSLVGSAEGVTVEEAGGSYLLERRTDSGPLVAATLRLSRSDLRATVQTLHVRSEGGEEREYRFVEGVSERIPAERVAPETFEPDAELMAGGDAVPEGAAVEAGAAAPSPAARATGETAATSSAVASRELEVEVAYLLSRIRADLGEQVNWTRTTGGQLRVEALAETEARRDEILRALGPVKDNPAVIVDVTTVAERARRERAAEGRAESVRDVEVRTGQTPADLELRRHLAARGVADERMDEEVRRFAARVTSRSRAALLHASALKRLVARFTPEEARSLEPEARGKWLGMVREHARGVASEVGVLEAELNPVFGGGGAAAAAGDPDPSRAAGRLVELSYANDAAVHAAFTVSEGAGGTSRVKSPEFRRSLREAVALASSIRAAYEK